MKRLDEKGYSLVESIIHLLIFIMLIQFTVLFFYWKAPVENVYQGDLLGEWELFSLELQELLEEVTRVEEVKPTLITFHTQRGKITIHQYDTMLRKVVDGTGHVPLLVNVKSSKFTVKDSELKIAVEMKDGMRKERTFVIGLYQE
ncbi:competence type IV pilus minor pilin ComGF [Sporosarcina sp. P34]|uniref:competence type IV pilus minor pilin ComGF n=1 Tax=Sporosarcina sp. P34 TaxID=2048247 RepID=UPI0013043D95|nr:competence type IV pilus minor pilin ComGF [Sporosarcina sp. P34]